MITLNGVMVLSCELLVTKVVQRWARRMPRPLCLLLLGAGLTVLTRSSDWSCSSWPPCWARCRRSSAGGPCFSYPGIAARPGLTARYMASMQTMFGLGTAPDRRWASSCGTRSGRSSWWCWAWSARLDRAGLVGLRHDAADDAKPSETPTPTPTRPIYRRSRHRSIERHCPHAGPAVAREESS